MYNITMFGKSAKIVFLVIFGVLALHCVYSQSENPMISIKGGTFLMGSPGDERGRHMTDEEPVHRVTISAFLMSKYPVTQEEYLSIMGVNPSENKGDNLPVDKASWNNAVEYCNKRSAAEGLTPVYTINGNNVTWNRQANGYRLPTESEWEYACRAGTTTPYYTGASMNDAGWSRENSAVVINGYNSRSSQSVGQKQPNDFGLYDMHGNVLEWCWDWMAPYTAEAKTDPIGPSTGTRRIYRGGCFDLPAAQCRSAYRFGQHQNLRMFYIGFRVARNAQ